VSTYLDAGAVRIQRYLARSPSLKGRRGASALLCELTSPQSVSSVLDGRAQVNPEAGEADGTISLVVPDQDAETVAAELLRHLRAELPGAEFQAAWGVGDSYVDAYAKRIKPSFEDGTALLSVPAVPELPVLRTCDHCGLDPVSAELRDMEGETVGVCADCERREKDAGHRSSTRQSTGLAAEERLYRLVGGEQAPPSGSVPPWVEDFDDLAKLGGGKQNHLATVLADGNSVGRFFERLAARGSTAKEILSRTFAEATFEALRLATLDVWSGAGPLPVVPHVAGGDDVLVSVPAELAWPFTRRFLTTFEHQVRRAVEEAEPSLAGDAPTVSAAVVFTHHTYPFRRCVVAAEAILAQAKAREAGTRSSVLWVDVTREGEQPPVGRAAWTLEEFGRHADAIAELQALAKHAQSALSAALARSDPDVAAARARLLADRLEITEVVRELLDDGGVARLGDALELARWWR